MGRFDAVTFRYRVPNGLDGVTFLTQGFGRPEGVVPRHRCGGGRQ